MDKIKKSYHTPTGIFQWMDNSMGCFQQWCVLSPLEQVPCRFCSHLPLDKEEYWIRKKDKEEYIAAVPCSMSPRGDERRHMDEEQPRSRTLASRRIVLGVAAFGFC